MRGTVFLSEQCADAGKRKMVEWNIKKSMEERTCVRVYYAFVYRYERVENGKKKGEKKKERAKKLDRVLLFLTLPSLKLSVSVCRYHTTLISAFMFSHT